MKRMTNRRLALAVILAVVANMVFAPLALAAPPQPPKDPQPIHRGDIIDIGPVLRAKNLPILGDTLGDVEIQASIQATQTYTVGSRLRFLALNDYLGSYYYTYYRVMTITQHSEVWVQEDLNYYNLDGTLNAIHPDAKDPLYITMDRINYLAQAFNDIIYPTDTSYFGMHDTTLDGSPGTGAWAPRYQSDDGSRVVILVSNVRDDNFYDPVHSASFIIGFYSPTFEYYSGRNMITLDSKQWNDRIGGSGHPTRAYDYDDTLAHEFQHLIHDDYSPNEDSWVNEGMSGLAEFLVGYFYSQNLGGRTEWQQWPQNSVIQWDDQAGDNPEHGRTGEVLADYQLSNAFMLYTAGRIGGSYTDTAKLTSESEDGILGYNKWMSDTSATNPAAAGLTFQQLFKDFRRDMLFGGYSTDAQPRANWNGNFISDYDSPLHKSGGPATTPAYLGELRDDLDREGYDWPGVPPFGTNFIEVCWSNVLSTTTWPVTLDGDESAPPTAWSSVAASDIYSPTSGTVDGDVLYSDHTDLTDNFVVFGPLTVNSGDQLTFDHYYNIEDYWDYGFVQVTTDTTGMTGWTSLSMAGMDTTLDPSAHPVIVANVPGFTSFSGGWITATYDIGAAYAGETILLAFRYSTDWASGGSDGDYAPGWAIDNVKVGSTVLTDGATTGARSIQQVRGAGSKFTFEFLTWGDGDVITVSHVYSATLDAAQTGTLDLATGALNDTGFDEAGERGVIMLSAMLDVYTDLIGGGILPQYANYGLTGLPPSLCTSDVDAWGVTHAGQRQVYAGEILTTTVHVDNIGSSPNVTTTGPIMAYVGVEVPLSTTFSSATGGAVYTDSLQTVSAHFPAVPGVYWVGLVTRTYDFDAAFRVASTLQDSTLINTPVHFADGAGTDQYERAVDSVTVVSAFGLSALTGSASRIPIGGVAPFTATLLNMSHAPKAMQLVANYPTDTTFYGISGAGSMVFGADRITVTQMVMPYETSGAANIIFQWQVGSSYHFDDVITGTATVKDLGTSDLFALDTTDRMVSPSFRIYLPIVIRD